jgi:hypothetical protein
MNQTKKPPVSRANRRVSRRWQLRNDAKVECRKGLGMGPNLVLSSLDISETGARVLLREGLSLGQEVEVLLVGTGLGRPVKRLANVIWSVATDSGCHCTGLHFQKVLRFAEMQLLTRPSGLIG